MELIRISDCKLKIMLTPTDMSQFELNVDNFGEDSAKMRKSFRLLLEEIRKRTDFDADDRQISVQYFPSREGGCEMFISQPSAAEKEDSPEKPEFRRPASALLPTAGRKRSSGAFRRECAYRFDAMDTLLRVCRRLESAGYIGDSTAYRDERNRYYLILTTLSSSPVNLPEELKFLTEYGTVENAPLLRLYLKEHGKTICPRDAVFHLSPLF